METTVRCQILLQFRPALNIKYSEFSNERGKGPSDTPKAHETHLLIIRQKNGDRRAEKDRSLRKRDGRSADKEEKSAGTSFGDADRLRARP